MQRDRDKSQAELEGSVKPQRQVGPVSDGSPVDVSQRKESELYSVAIMSQQWF